MSAVQSGPAGRGALAHPSPVLVIPALVAAAAVSIPLFYVCLRAIEGGAARYMELVTSELSLQLLWRTLLLVAGVVPLAAFIGVSMAWLVTRTRLPGRRIWAVLAALPLVFPSYLASFALVSMLGPGGVLQELFGPAAPIRLGDLAYGYSGALIALGFFTYPYVYLMSIAALRETDQTLEEAAQSLGSGPWRRFRDVVLPQLLPAVRSGSLLVTLYVLSDFGAVSIVRYQTFTLGIYNAYRGLFDRSVAAALSTVLILVTLVFIAGEASFRRPVHKMKSVAARPPLLLPLGRWTPVALGWSSLVIGVGFAIPTLTILHWVARALETNRALDWTFRGTAESVGISITAALTATLFAIPVALWSARHPSSISRGVSRIVFAGYALPGLVVALALVFFATRSMIVLYQTLGLLLAGYVVRFLPESVGAIESSAARLSPNYELAARSLGASRSRTFRTITLPLLRGGILTGGGLVFLTTIKELPATLILRPSGFETLATRIWTLVTESFYAEAAIPSLVLILVSALPLYALVIRPVLGSSR